MKNAAKNPSGGTRAAAPRTRRSNVAAIIATASRSDGLVEHDRALLAPVTVNNVAALEARRACAGRQLCDHPIAARLEIHLRHIAVVDNRADDRTNARV